MLRLAETDGYQSDAMIPAVPGVVPAASPATGFQRGGRYGEDRRFSPATVAAVVAAHVAVFAVAIYLQPQFHREKEHRLKMVEMRLEPPPAPPAQPKPKQAETVKLEIKPFVPPPPVPLVSTMTMPVETSPQPVAVSPPAPPAPPAPAAPPAPPSVVQGGNIGTQMVSGKPPRYPMDSRRKHEQGTVVLAITLGTDGRVAACAIARSSGFASLDNAARDAVRGWRWAPTIRDGQPVMVRGVVEIPFVLQG